MRPDDDANVEVYGRKLTARQIVTGKVRVPRSGRHLVRCCRRTRRATTLRHQRARNSGLRMNAPMSRRAYSDTGTLSAYSAATASRRANVSAYFLTKWDQRCGLILRLLRPCCHRSRVAGRSPRSLLTCSSTRTLTDPWRHRQPVTLRATVVTSLPQNHCRGSCRFRARARHPTDRDHVTPVRHQRSRLVRDKSLAFADDGTRR
jgi:hypothetical protein